jgi:acyl-homoserine lactone acylase PvdQ
MPTKYRTARKFPKAEIEAVEVVRETEKFVVLRNSRGEYREAKDSEYTIYHNTWEEAHCWLVDRARNKLSAAQSNLEYAERFVIEVSAMSSPSREAVSIGPDVVR